MPQLAILPIGPGQVEDALPALHQAIVGKGPLLLPVAGAGNDVAPADLDQDVLPPGGGLAVGTSGSTGAAKRAVLTAEALRASAEATHQRLGGPGRWLLALPAEHIGGMMTLIRSMVAGLEPAILDMSNGFSARAFIRAIRSGEVRYTALVPAQLSRVLDTPAGVSALRDIAGVLVGGGPVPDMSLARARHAGVRTVVTYGMSETCGGCVYDGVPLDGVRMRLTDPGETAPGVAPGTGRIELAGPMLAQGYLADADRTADAFRVEADGTRWLRTDDLGVIRPDGRLAVVGRTDDVIISAGVKVWPNQVERALAAILPTGTEVAVVGLPDERWGHIVAAAIVVPTESATSGSVGGAGSGARTSTEEMGVTSLGSSPDTDLSDLHRRLREFLPRAAMPRRVRQLERMPTTAIGKPDRPRLREVLAQPRWDDGVIRQ